MVIAALVTFAALVVAWLAAPSEAPTRAPAVKPTVEAPLAEVA